MAIHIDIATVQRLVETLAETVNDLTGPVTLRVIHTGESYPDQQDGEVWAAVSAMRVARRTRRSRDEEPWADIEIVFDILCPEATTADSAYAIGSAVEHVSRALECATIDDSGTSGHIVELHNTEYEDQQAGQFQQIVGATLTVRGEVRRVSGTTQEVRH
jgi:hypothetical protein